MKSFAKIAGFYLPHRFRRWFIYLPINAAMLLLLGTCILFLKASFVHGDEFFDPHIKPKDIQGQFHHLHGVLQKSVERKRLNIMEGYSDLCGNSTEWDACFYSFYSMALREWAKSSPENAVGINADLTLCARGVLHIPSSISNEELKAYFEKREYKGTMIYGGYMGIVLGCRKLVVKDDLFDVALTKNAEGLVQYIDHCLDHSDQFWTSDHATQLYAIWLYDQACNKDHRWLFQKWENIMRERFIQKGSGLLFSEIGVCPDKVLSEPRGSSIGWTALFLIDVLPEFASEQYRQMCIHREKRFANIAATPEFSSRSLIQFGDTDSGPLIFGMSPSATGEALCCHKLFGNKDRFTRLLRIFELFGRPRRDQTHMSYWRANALGDAILLYAKIAPSRTEILP